MYSRAGPQKGIRNYTSNYNPNATCDHYKIKGHYMRDCYKLVGYLTRHLRHGEQKGVDTARGFDHRNKQRRTQYNAHNAIAGDCDNQISYGSSLEGSTQLAYPSLSASTAPSSLFTSNYAGPPRFTNRQYDQICKLLEQPHHNIPSANSVNLSGKSEALLVSNGPQQWIIDTGSTNHMASVKELLNTSSVVPVAMPRPVYLPNGDIANVTH